jgi:hypothetical protein
MWASEIATFCVLQNYITNTMFHITINYCRKLLTFMGPCTVNVFLSITNKMQCCIILFSNVNTLHVSSGFSAHHQELKSVHAASGICQTCLLLPLAVAARVLYNIAQCWLCLRMLQEASIELHFRYIQIPESRR